MIAGLILCQGEEIWGEGWRGGGERRGDWMGGEGRRGEGSKGQNRGIHLSLYAVFSLSLISIPHPFFPFLSSSSSLLSLHHSIAIYFSFFFFILHISFSILEQFTLLNFYPVFNVLCRLISHSYFYSYLKIWSIYYHYYQTMQSCDAVRHI